MSSGTRHILAVMLGLWALAGCTSGAAETCVPTLGIDTCDKGFFCSQVGVCTKGCQSASDCRVACTQAGGPTCAANEACEGGFCASTLDSVCVDGRCQEPCAATDAGCHYDPYGPIEPSGTGGRP